MVAIDPEKAVMLCLSYQVDSVNGNPGGVDIVAKAAKLLKAARRHGMPVIHGVVEFRPGYPEVGPRSAFNAMKAIGRLRAGDPSNAVDPRISPEPSDITLIKRRPSAFTATDLELLLKAGGRDTIVMMGFRTSGAVIQTYYAATNLDYDPIVITDCCSDHNLKVHSFISEHLIAEDKRMTSDELLANLG